MAPDLDQYFARIGFAGSARPDHVTLAEICKRHPAAIPFENLDPLLGRPVPLDLESLQDKLVDRGRGGWCFEHNLLLSHVLRAIGFEVEQLAARVLWADPNRVGPRSHMLLRVDLPEGPQIVDVGFGVLTLTGVLKLQPDAVQSTPHESFRLRALDDELVMEVQLSEQWKPMYRFDQARQEQIDYEVSSWFLCTNVASPFRRMLMCARAAPGVRYALRNNVLTTHEQGQPPQRRALDNAEALENTLRQTLQIRLPLRDDSSLVGLRERLAEIASHPAS